jgi:hypothetical protein
LGLNESGAARITKQMSVTSQRVLKRKFSGPIVAAAAGLATLGSVTSCAQVPILDANGIATLPAHYEERVLAPLDSGLPDLAAFAQTNGSAPPQGQDQSNADQNSSAETARQLSVNPITGLVSASQAAYTPLTGEERWSLYWKMNFLSAGAYFGPVFSALVLDQATGSPAKWGGGFAGYGRRVASRTASAMLQGTFQAPAAFLLHEDVRYIVSKGRGFKHRALHAIVYSFLTYNNSGHATLNVANLSAYYASTAASTAWLPGHYKVLDYTLSNSTEQFALTLPINLLQEFWPEIVRKLRRRSE